MPQPSGGIKILVLHKYIKTVLRQYYDPNMRLKISENRLRNTAATWSEHLTDILLASTRVFLSHKVMVYRAYYTVA
jgi:hypothetical protein